ncbi:MAG: insulinase family protein [Lachnospiraceae bacterium]|nr:insulinase family protein [Lachnospiraceae bacterium]
MDCFYGESKEQLVKTTTNIPVYSYPNPHLHSFCICLYVKAGSMYEKKSENGITHFFEHVVIRNVNRLMDGRLYQILDKLGLSLNGATYKEFVHFTISGASVHFREAARIFLKLLEPLALSEEEIDTERKRILAEIREYDKKKSLEARTEREVWKGTSLTRTIAGKKKRLKQMGKRELMDFRRTFFDGKNLFFYLTGNCSEKETAFFLEELEKQAFFDGTGERQNLAPVPKGFFKRTGRPLLAKGSETEVSFSFDVDVSRYTGAMLNLFYNMLFTGDYCPVYQELSEKTGYIYSYGDQFERYQNIGSLQLNYEVSADKFYKAFAKTMNIFCRLKKDGGNLEYVRAIYLDNGDMAIDDAEDFNWNRAYDCHIMGEDYPDIEAKKQAYLKVQESDMARMARDIFRLENLTVVVRGKKKVSRKKIEKLMRRLEANH